MSQVDVACEADLTTSFVRHLEAGTITPDADTLLQIAECLRLPLRARNAMLTAAGHPPPFPQHGFETPSLAPARDVVETVLAAMDPSPAIAIDRHWRVLASNLAVPALTAGVVEPLILRPPVNLMRLFLHPAGLATRIVNLAQWRDHMTARLQRDVEEDRDPGLADLLEEVRDYPCPPWLPDDGSDSGVAVPLRLATLGGTLSFIVATTRFAHPMDVTVSEIAIETFLPADAETAAHLRWMRAS